MKSPQIHRALAAALCSIIAPQVLAATPVKALGADPYDPNWQLVQSEYRCALEQTVPEFGRVAFSQTPDTELRFELLAETPFYRGGTTPLKARPPSWRADLRGYLIAAKSTLADDDMRASFSAEHSLRAQKALKDGLSLQLTFMHGKPTEHLAITVQGLGYSSLLSSFESCKEASQALLLADQQRLEAEREATEELAASMAKLNANSPKMAALTEGELEPQLSPLQRALDNLPDFYRIPFDREDTELSGSSAGYLDQLLRRWELRGMPEQVLLHGHADDAADATASYINSDLRAQAVARYLVARMPDLQLRIEAHGDTLRLEERSSQRVDVVPSDLPNWE